MSDWCPVDAKALANLFLDWASDDGMQVSPMKLQKLLFFAHADFLVRFRKPLIKQEFEAWDYGPVIPSVFQEFKTSAKAPITSRARAFNPVTAMREVACCSPPAAELSAIRAVYDFYRPASATDLSRMSHELEGVWRHARGMFVNGLNMDRRISNDMILSYHRPIHS